jgi:hypothetical protein
MSGYRLAFVASLAFLGLIVAGLLGRMIRNIDAENSKPTRFD